MPLPSINCIHSTYSINTYSQYIHGFYSWLKYWVHFKTNSNIVSFFLNHLDLFVHENRSTLFAVHYRIYLKEALYAYSTQS